MFSSTEVMMSPGPPRLNKYVYPTNRDLTETVFLEIEKLPR